MQLSAAMHHEEIPGHHNDANDGGTTAPGHAQDDSHHVESVDFSSLLGSLNSVLGHNNSGTQRDHPQSDQQQQSAPLNVGLANTGPPNRAPVDQAVRNQPAQTQNQPASLPSPQPAHQMPLNPGALSSGPAVQSQAPLDLSNIDLNTLGNLRLSDLGILGNLFNPNNNQNNILQTLGTLSQLGNLANQASRGQLGAFGQTQTALGSPSISHQHPSHLAPSQSATLPQHGGAQQPPPAPIEHASVQTAPHSSVPSNQQPTSRDTEHTRPRDLPFQHVPTTIDPEVSSIQSVLQSLLTGSGGDAAGTSERSEARPPPGPEHSQSAQAGPSAPEFGNLSDLGLTSEDQGLIESLKSAMGGSSGVKPSQLAETLPRSSAEFADRVLRPKSAGITKAKKPKPPVHPIVEHRSQEGAQSDFNASDTDTLRDIQQALLSSMGPLASSTSLAESLTSTAAAHSAAAAAAATDTAKRADSQIFEPRAPPIPRPLVPALAPAKAADPRVSKSTTKKAVSKVVKPTEVDKQKIREENAARKRKWREVHLMQNRDNDLRLRIVKRANEIHGTHDSEKKTQWINEEFERRRQRRIMRAGINSIVDAAKARAARAAENGEPSRSPLEYTRLNVNDQARTLTQQSKQAATSHLSQLFRSSNAALGPQLHNEKVPVPMVAYMLVSSPKRPPYRFSWLKKNEDNKQSEVEETSASTKDPVKKSSSEKSDTMESRTQSDKSTEKRDELKETLAKDKLDSSGPSQNNENDEAEGVQGTKHKNKAPEEEPADVSEIEKSQTTKESAEKNQSESNNIQKVQTGAGTVDKGQTDIHESVLDARPKHRYSLIGKLKLGVPPNLTSIYRKIRGATPQDYLGKFATDT